MGNIVYKRKMDGDFEGYCNEDIFKMANGSYSNCLKSYYCN